MLGLGLGMVMQVLVLAVQNAVDPRNMGVATSGLDAFPTDRRLDRRLHLRGDLRQPPCRRARLATAYGRARTAGDRSGGIRALPPAARSAFEEAFAAALHPVFLTAAGVALLAFALSWLIPDLRLRDTVACSARGAARDRAANRPRRGLVLQNVERFLDLFTEPLVELGVLAHELKAALLEHSDRAEVAGRT